jgi:ankyrin repeat protein
VFESIHSIGFPLQELCRKVQLIDHHLAGENEYSDEEDDEEDTFTQLERRTNQEIYKLARHMILQSQSIEDPVLHRNAGTSPTVMGAERHKSVLTVGDLHGNTPLHVLCSQCADPTMMKVFFENCPQEEAADGEVSARAVDLVAMKNDQGCTPLHFVAGRDCPFSAFKFILQHTGSHQSNGEDIRGDARLIPDDDGDIPLHWAFSAGSSPRRLRALLDGCRESLLYRNEKGKLPMQEFVDNHCNQWDFLDDDEKRALWNEMQEILKVVTEAEDDDTTWSPLHAIASGVDFIPREFWTIGSEFHEHDVRSYNVDGLLPLHVAVSTAPSQYIGESFPLPDDGTKWSIRKTVIWSSLELVNMPTSQGRLALHLAAESRQPEWIVCTLRDAFPDALLTFDPTTGLPPVMLAAVDENNCLDVVYSLLRSDPSILQVRL